MHFAVVVSLGHYSRPVTWENGVIAESLNNGTGFSFPHGNTPQPSSWQSPGYPTVLWLIWRGLGQTSAAYLIMGLLQAVIISSMIFPVGWLTNRWFGNQAAIAARWITCLMPLYAWYATRYQQTAIAIAIHPWVLAAWLKTYDTAKLRYGLGAGIATGIGGLFQPILLPFFGLVSVVAGISLWLRKQTRAFLCVVFAGLLTLLVLTPWTVRNWRVHGRLVPIKTNFAYQLWMGNNPQATGSAFAEGGRIDTFAASPPASATLAGKVPEAVYMDSVLADAWGCITADPEVFVIRTIKRIAWFWTAVPPKYLRSYDEAEALRFWWLHTGYWLSFVTLAVIARLTSGKFPREYTAVILLCVLLYSLTYGVTIVGNARFRGEIEYLLIPATSAGLVWCITRWKHLAASRRSKSGAMPRQD